MEIQKLMDDAYELAIEKGFYNGDERPIELLAMIHTEVSEAINIYRKKGMKDYSSMESLPTELADVILRTLTFCRHFNIDIENSLIKKMEYNKKRVWQNVHKI